MTEFEKNLALATIIPYLPPQVQKILVDFILRDCEIRLSDRALREYEDYFKRVDEKFKKTYMEKQ